MSTTMGFPTGTVRAYWLATIVFICGFKSGYDGGVAGAVLTFKSFQRDFHYTDQTKVNSFTVGFQQLGSFVACIFVPMVSARLGRRAAILLSAAIFMVGAIIETCNTHSLGAWLTGRIIAGIGLGGCSVVVPTYSSEMAPREIRGRMGSFYQWFYSFGIFTSYWGDYGVSKHIPTTSSKQWQIPIGVQLIAPAFLFMGLLTLPESTRWLVMKGRDEDAFRSLSWVRGGDGPRIQAEFAEIKQGVEDLRKEREGLSWRELISPANRARLATGVMLFTFQQMTAATALANFGPQFFKLLVGGGEKDILLTGLFGAVKVVAVTTFIFFLSERFGRRMLLVWGGISMGTCLLACGLVFHYHAPPGNGTVTPAGKATVALIYLAIICYNWSWGPVPWAMVPELFPTRTRDLGMSVSVGAHWLWSFVFSFSTPYMLNSWGWGIFIFYAVWCYVMGVVCFFTLRETRNKSLEHIQKEFEVAGGKARLELDSEASSNYEDFDSKSAELSSVDKM